MDDRQQGRLLMARKSMDAYWTRFLGSGTTAIVAKRLGRRYVGIELNEDYARMAAEQIEGPLFAGV